MNAYQNFQGTPSPKYQEITVTKDEVEELYTEGKLSVLLPDKTMIVLKVKVEQ